MRWPRTALAIGAPAAALLLASCLVEIDRSRISPSAVAGDASGSIDGAELDADELATDGGDFDCEGATLCDGFEREGVLGAWSAKREYRATIALTDERWRRGRRSAVVSLEASTSSGDTASFLESPPLPDGAKRTTLRYALFVSGELGERILTVSPTAYDDGEGRGLTLFLYLHGPTRSVRFVALASTPGAADAYATIGETGLDVDRWVDVSIELDHVPSPARVTLSYDGKIVRDAQPIGVNIPSVAPRWKFGVTYATPGTAVRIYFDDVRLDIVR